MNLIFTFKNSIKLENILKNMVKNIMRIIFLLILLLYSSILFIAALPIGVKPVLLDDFRVDLRNIMDAFYFSPGQYLVSKEKPQHNKIKYVCFNVYGLNSNSSQIMDLFSTDEDCKPPILRFNSIIETVYYHDLKKIIKNYTRNRKEGIERIRRSGGIGKLSNYYCNLNYPTNKSFDKIIITGMIEIIEYKDGKTKKYDEVLGYYNCSSQKLIINNIKNIKIENSLPTIKND